jgi:hypothetical protein
LINSLDCSEDDREALFTLCLFHSLIKNQGGVTVSIFQHQPHNKWCLQIIAHVHVVLFCFAGVDSHLLRSIGLFPGQVSYYVVRDCSVFEMILKSVFHFLAM